MISNCCFEPERFISMRGLCFHSIKYKLLRSNTYQLCTHSSKNYSIIIILTQHEQFSSHQFLVKSPIISPILNHQFFCFKSPKYAVYFSCDNILQLNYRVHFGHLKQKYKWFEIGDLVGDFTKTLVAKMDGSPNSLPCFL